MSGQPPYPSAQPAGPAPSLPPPTSAAPTAVPKVFGILSIIFASLMILFSLPTSCMSLAGPAMGTLGQIVPDDDPNAAAVQGMMESIGTAYTAMGVQGLLLLVMSSILLAVGIGQVRYRRWAAEWSVYWGIGGLVSVGLMIALMLGVVGPAYEQMFATIAETDSTAQLPEGFGSFLGSAIGGWTALMTVIFYAPYPLLMVIFFKRPNVQAAMNQ